MVPAAQLADMVPVEEYDKLVAKYNRLRQMFSEQEQKREKDKIYVARATEKYRAAKESARLWQAYHDKLRRREQAKTLSFDEAIPRQDGNETSRTASKSSNTAHRISSSQTTEGEPEPSSTAEQAQDSDDEPVLVSTKYVSRGRSGSARSMPPPVRIKQEYVSPEVPIELASEEYSSPIARRKRPLRTETSDLDALVSHVDTPRKQKRRRAVSQEPERSEMLLTATSSLSEGDLPEFVEPAVPERSELQVDHDFRHVPLRMDSNGDALQRLDPNARMKPGRKRNKISLLSEDGDDQTSQVITPDQNITPKPLAGGRLDTLLDEPSTDRTVLPKRATPETLIRPGKRPIALEDDAEVNVEKHSRLTKPSASPKKRAAANVKKPSGSPSRSFKLPRGLEEPPRPMTPEDEPLRLRPLDSLNLDDFRINKKYMGADYAFSDTFRGREQRRCLPGCTKPDCCGNAFRKAVEMGGVKNTKSDAEVLEGYLGPDFATIMGAYGRDRRKTVLTEARAYAFANQHGKHRQAFERRSTPPGFWRTDMPTTQEAEEDRARAHEMERQKVEERWREAMRHSGRWRFRDE